MSETAWYRSLYWRIGLGFVLFLAGLLAVQGGVLVWMIARGAVAPGPPPPEVTRLAARDLGEALTDDPQLDIKEFLQQEYEGRVPLVAIMKDGRVISSDGTLPSDQIVNQFRARLNADPESFGRMGRGGPRASARHTASAWADEASRTGRRHFDQRRGSGRRDRDAPIRVPATRARRSRQSVWCSSAIGTTLAAIVIFAPVRRRLRSLEDSARQVGRGDLSARAREDGGDEVAALARTFNQMTQDLQARAQQLEASHRARRLLLADVSHELMTPLTGMRGYLETLSLHAGVARCGHTGPLPVDHSRRDPAGRAHRRRSSGSCAAGGWRRFVRVSGRFTRGAVRPCARAS